MKPCMLLFGFLVLLAASSHVHAKDGPPGSTCSPNCPVGQDGRVPKRNQQLVCKACKPGQFKSATTNCCRDCDGLLTFDAAGIPNGCTPCPAGSKGLFDRTTNTSSCWCKDGFQASGPAGPSGVPGCVACTPGTFNPNRTQSETACQPCPADTVAPRNGSERCFPCSPAFNGSFAVNATTCLCPPGTFVQLPPPRPRGGRGARGRMLLKDGRDNDKPEGPKPGDDFDGLFKKGAQCVACNTTTDNSQLPGNLWRACCATGTTWNGTACV